MLFTKPLTSFSATKRRYKQKLFENIGLAPKTDDSEFKIYYEEYATSMKELKNVHQLFVRQIEAAKVSSQAVTSLCLHMAHFNKGNSSHQAAVDLFNAIERIDSVTANAISQIYSEKVMGHLDQFLWNESEIIAKVAQRQQLLTDLNAYQRKFKTVAEQLENQNLNSNNSQGGVLFKKKTESELQCDLETRKIQLQQADDAFHSATEELCAHFEQLVEARQNGDLLRGPMTALYTCQRHIAQMMETKLAMIKKGFPDFEQLENDLKTVEQTFEVNVPKTEMFATTTTATNGMGSSRQLLKDGVFGASLSAFGEESSPVIEDCIALLNDPAALQTRDLFKLNGASDYVNEYRRQFNEGKQNFLVKCRASPVDAAYLLKIYLRELPEALIPEAFYQMTLDAVRNREDVAKQQLAAIIQQIPDQHFAPLLKLLVLLNRIGRRALPSKDGSAVQNMTFNKLAAVLGQIILRPEIPTPQKLNEDLPLVMLAVEMMIKEANTYAQME